MTMVNSSAGAHVALIWRAHFFYREGDLTVLGDLSDSGDTTPHAINESSQIVGQSGIGYVERPWGYSHISHAFLYDNGVMTDLNTLIPENSGWELMYATDINNRGLWSS